jgi:hypothetical protein
MRRVTIRSRAVWTLLAVAAAAYWAAVVAFAPLISSGLALLDPAGAGIGLLVAFVAGQLATCGYRPGRRESGGGIV